MSQMFDNIHTNSSSKNINSDLDEFVKCCICNQKYTINIRAPVTVSCGHTFCRACCNKTIIKPFFKCYICRENVIFGHHDTPKENFLYLALLIKLNFLEVEAPEENMQMVLYNPKVNFDIVEQIVQSMNTCEIAIFLNNYFYFIRPFFYQKLDKLNSYVDRAFENGKKPNWKLYKVIKTHAESLLNIILMTNNLFKLMHNEMKNEEKVFTNLIHVMKSSTINSFCNPRECYFSKLCVPVELHKVVQDAKTKIDIIITKSFKYLCFNNPNDDDNSED